MTDDLKHLTDEERAQYAGIKLERFREVFHLLNAERAAHEGTRNLYEQNRAARRAAEEDAAEQRARAERAERERDEANGALKIALKLRHPDALLLAAMSRAVAETARNALRARVAQLEGACTAALPWLDAPFKGCIAAQEAIYAALATPAPEVAITADNRAETADNRTPTPPARTRDHAVEVVDEYLRTTPRPRVQIVGRDAPPARTVEEERADVVAFLRHRIGVHPDGREGVEEAILDEAADSVARGEHVGAAKGGRE